MVRFNFKSLDRIFQTSLEIIKVFGCQERVVGCQNNDTQKQKEPYIFFERIYSESIKVKHIS